MHFQNQLLLQVWSKYVHKHVLRFFISNSFSLPKNMLANQIKLYQKSKAKLSVCQLKVVIFYVIFLLLSTEKKIKIFFLTFVTVNACITSEGELCVHMCVCTHRNNCRHACTHRLIYFSYLSLATESVYKQYHSSSNWTIQHPALAF